VLQIAAGSLSALADSDLITWQAAVDAAGTYAQQVASAKAAWPKKNKKANKTFKEIKRVLTAACSGTRRCMYCEDSMADEVEHVRPKDYYPGLVFGWANYLYACGPCNGPKNNKFAVIDPTGVETNLRSLATGQAPPPHDPLFVEPRSEDPFDFIALDVVNTFEFVPRSGLPSIARRRAEYTIDLLCLNDRDLPAARLQAHDEFLAVFERYVRLATSNAPPARVAGAQRTVMRHAHPSVWHEVVRVQTALPDWAPLFAAAPAALTWNVGR
jgi:uncharacterized protein (TIGR02646 family)